jgi:glycosyltransferase involved in cell wall biosynthesis/nucleotide-binding universal stress UspA family protein
MAIGREGAPLNVLIPGASVAALGNLIALGNAVVRQYGGEGTVLSVVEVPEERSLSEGALVVQRRRRLLRRVEQIQPEHAFRAEVRTAHSVENGIRNAVRDSDTGLVFLNWKPKRRIEPGGVLESLFLDPPCDLAVLKRGTRRHVESGVWQGAPGRADGDVRPYGLGQQDFVRSVLLPVRGGPHARLALKIAEAIAAESNALLTLLHIDLRHWDLRRRATEDRFFDAIRSRVTYPGASELRVDAESAEAALMRLGAEHDLVVMGAAARDETSPFLFGRIPMRVARAVKSSVIIAKTREPVTVQTFGLADPPEGAEGPDISHVVDRWFAENTFHSHEFRQLRDLIDLKERQSTSISVALPTLDEEKTIGKILSTIKKQLIERFPLIDELVVVDSGSSDRTVEIAESLDVPVYQHRDVLPQHGTYEGKGEGLWKSLFITHGEIVVWVDSDITGFHPKFVYGLIGPLLTQPRLQFVKGFYRRPLNLGGQRSTTGGGRVTELTARPLINLFYPELSGLVQPLAGEMAGRRSTLESVPFFTGYGVETGLLIDILDRYGLQAIAQSDLQERVHRNQTLFSLSKMAFAILQVVLKRLDERRRIDLIEDVSTSMKLIHYSPTELFLEIQEIREQERPPINSLPEYSGRFRQPVGAVFDRSAGSVAEPANRS